MRAVINNHKLGRHNQKPQVADSGVPSSAAEDAAAAAPPSEEEQDLPSDAERKLVDSVLGRRISFTSVRMPALRKWCTHARRRRLFGKGKRGTIVIVVVSCSAGARLARNVSGRFLIYKRYVLVKRYHSHLATLGARPFFAMGTGCHLMTAARPPNKEAAVAARDVWLVPALLSSLTTTVFPPCNHRESFFLFPHVIGPWLPTILPAHYQSPPSPFPPHDVTRSE